MNPIFYIDFYKVGHVQQYQKGITRIWSNWTPRSTRTSEYKVVHFGLQYFIKKYLEEEFNTNFFNRDLHTVLTEYRKVISSTLGVNEPKTDHIEYLWKLRKLPLKIYSLPEGTVAPIRLPSVVVVNTDPNCFWLPNYIETLMSNTLWISSTSATTARLYRKIFTKYAKQYGEKDFGFIDWQGHDFSFRGMSGLESAILSGMGHLLSFSGTDTIPAILALNKYYGADLSCGGSVPATEHSVMCAGGYEEEFETFKRLLTEVYPDGIVSIVSDTWDLWKVLTEYIPRLKDNILTRNGKLIIRPDSGNPVNILCGDQDAFPDHPAYKGTIRLMAEALGTTNGLINNGGVIYGDSITPERAEAILERVVNEIKLSPYNCVFGIGSYTYQYVTRDTYGFAMKATAVEKDGRVIPIFKNPVTDDGMKKSLKGIPVVYNGHIPEHFLLEEVDDPSKLDDCAYDLVYDNGLKKEYTLAEIRERVRSNV